MRIVTWKARRQTTDIDTLYARAEGMGLRIEGSTSSYTHFSKRSAAGSLLDVMSRYKSPSEINLTCWIPPAVSRGFRIGNPLQWLITALAGFA